MSPARLPAAPLVARVELLGGMDRRWASALRQTYYRGARAGWFTVEAADRLASGLLGEHPMAVWGDEWRYGPQAAAAGPPPLMPLSWIRAATKARIRELEEQWRADADELATARSGGQC